MSDRPYNSRKSGGDCASVRICIHCHGVENAHEGGKCLFAPTQMDVREVWFKNSTGRIIPNGGTISINWRNTTGDTQTCEAWDLADYDDLIARGVKVVL